MLLKLADALLLLLLVLPLPTTLSWFFCKEIMCSKNCWASTSSGVSPSSSSEIFPAFPGTLLVPLLPEDDNRLKLKVSLGVTV